MTTIFCEWRDIDRQHLHNHLKRIRSEGIDTSNLKAVMDALKECKSDSSVYTDDRHFVLCTLHWYEWRGRFERGSRPQCS